MSPILISWNPLLFISAPPPPGPLPLQLALLWLEVLTLDGAKRIRLGGDLVLNLTDLKPVLQLKEKR